MRSGVLPVFKQAGVSSYDVIRCFQCLSRDLKKIKIGHAGTLDPFAEGVLPLLIGEATKLFGFLLDHEKEYETWIQFGVLTSTDDSTGEVLALSDKGVSYQAVVEAIQNFSGKILQVPPRYSAVKLNGKRAYERVRSGEEVSLRPKEVEVFSHELLEYDEKRRLLHSRIRCSSGTYIRSLARDMGNYVGCYGHVVRLVRTKVFCITLADCVRLEEITLENWWSFLIPMERMVSFPILEVKQPFWVTQGRALVAGSFVFPPPTDGMYQIQSSGKLLAIGEWRENRFFYHRVFHG